MSDESSVPQGRKKQIQLALLVVLIPIGIFGSLRTYGIYSRVLESERLFLTAQQKMEAKDWKASLDYLDQCLRVNPIYFPAYEAEAVIYADEMKDDKAVRAVLEKAVAECKDDPRAQQLYGFYLLHHFKDYPKAQEYLRAAARGLPNDVPLRNMLRDADKAVAGGKLPPGPHASPMPAVPGGQPAATVQPAAPSGQPAATVQPALPSGQPAATVQPALPSGQPAATVQPAAPSGQPSNAVHGAPSK